jgi:hypothetical protein
MLGVKGYVYITSRGYDPEKGKSIKDPFLGDIPSLGACMPNIRQQVAPGDHILVISGRVPKAKQYIVGGFEVAEKIRAADAYRRFPDQRLRLTVGGELTGNIIIDAQGKQHPLDRHDPATFARRIENYVVGRNPIALITPDEIARGREETLYVLQYLLGKSGDSPFNVLGRWRKLDHRQVTELRDWLMSLKSAALALAA